MLRYISLCYKTTISSYFYQKCWLLITVISVEGHTIKNIFRLFNRLDFKHNLIQLGSVCLCVRAWDLFMTLCKVIFIVFNGQQGKFLLKYFWFLPVSPLIWLFHRWYDCFTVDTLLAELLFALNKLILSSLTPPINPLSGHDSFILNNLLLVINLNQL